MKYMMFVCTDTEPDTDESRMPDIEVWVAENDAAGRRLEGNVLAPSRPRPPRSGCAAASCWSPTARSPRPKR